MLKSNQQTVLSGIQPTGRLHVGNYLGSVKNFISLQHTHRCFFMIADYHSITENYDPKQKYNQIIDLASSFIAAGLNPKKCTLFVQSFVPEHLELAWIFNTLTPIGYLERMTQYKDKSGAQKENINAGLFDYPVLQAADILLYKPSAVPVGNDQDQHLELTREIVRLFNNKFGATFAEPKTLHTDTPRVMSLLEPNKKMSKSLGENHCLYLDDEPDVIKKKLSRAVTDSGEGSSAGTDNLFLLLEAFAERSLIEKFKHDKRSGKIKYSELKIALGESIGAYFAAFRKQKKALATKQVAKILQKGNVTAQNTAAETMIEVRKKIGLRP